MTKPVRLLRVAETEFVAAEEFYEERAGLGGDFVAAIAEAGRRIARAPRECSLAPDAFYSFFVFKKLNFDFCLSSDRI